MLINSFKDYDRDRLICFTSKLVQVNTENPPGNEANIVPVLEERLDKLGFTISNHGQNGRPNLVACRQFQPDGPTLLFCGHLDVVPANEADWTHNPYQPTVVGNRLYGRGTADMKGAISAYLEAARVLIESRTSLAGTLVTALVSDEEAMGRFGAAYHAKEGLLQADTAIVGEPTGLEPVLAERGAVWVRIMSFGKAAHGSTPELGVNAVEKLCKVIPHLKKALPNIHHDLVSSPTINFGTFHGGTKINIVPDRAVLEIDRRTIPGEESAEVFRSLEACLRKIEKDDDEARFSIEVIDIAEPCEISPDENIAQVAVSVLRGLGYKPKFKGMKGVTDARFLVNDCNIPTLIIGPGNLPQAHTADEYIELDQLEQAVRVYAEMIRKFLS